MAAFTPSAVLSAQSHRPETLYFAYGSNLHFEQMCGRCPTSRYLGRGRLHKYEWQVNTRGFANVMPVSDPSRFVDGLCYLLSASDEARLDRSEGVPTAYQKRFLNIDFFPANVALVGRRVSDIMEDRKLRSRQLFDATDRNNIHEVRPSATVQAGRHEIVFNQGVRRSRSVPENADRQIKERATPARTTVITKAEPTRALVYLSSVTKVGRPWDEYIDRMNWGLTEALSLGISQAYVDNAVRPLLISGRGPREVQRARTHDGRQIITGGQGRLETGPDSSVGEKRARRRPVSQSILGTERM